jgi:hypothetical protein
MNQVETYVLYFYSRSMKGSLGARVQLPPCDQEVTGSRCVNSLLQKLQRKAAYRDPKVGPTLPRNPRKAGASSSGLVLFYSRSMLSKSWKLV